MQITVKMELTSSVALPHEEILISNRQLQMLKHLVIGPVIVNLVCTEEGSITW